jgi:hypothetical protein
MIYEYEHKKSGGRMVLVRSMKSPPPETVRRGGRVWKRVYEAPTVRVKDTRPGTTYAGSKLPVSHGLPLMPETGYTTASEHGHTIRVYKDGTRADSRGRRIMANESDVTRAKKAGFVRDNDA